jgi:predicted ATPase/class 3 adenylate cyclase
VNCPNCRAENPPGARFCHQCGHQLPALCTNCGTALQENARFCHNCGHPVQSTSQTESLQPPDPSISTPQSPTDQVIRRYLPKELLARLEHARSSHLMSGERRIVTILFCDVQGSTAAAARLDPEEWAEIMNGAFEHMIQPIYRYEGTVARLQGDGLLAFFGAPVAHEDDPERAVLAGLEIVAAIQPYKEQVHRRWKIDLNVRVGVNTGLVVVGEVGSDLRVEYTALGDAINLAARMEQHAQPGSVLVAEPTYRLIAPLFDVEVIDNLEVKGYTQTLRAFRPLRRKEQPGDTRGLPGLSAPLIGRQEQMRNLQKAADQLQQGQGQVVSIIGEAGLGKSRLVQELERQLRSSHPSIQWLEGRTLSYQSNLPFAPFIDLLARFLDLPAQAAYPELLDRLYPIVRDKAGELAPFLGYLTGTQLDEQAAERIQYIQPQRLRATLFSKVGRLFELLLTHSSLVLYLDDLHWSDPTSIELLQSLLPLTERLPLMVITAFRPLQSEPSWQYHQTAKENLGDRYQALQLQPLSEVESRQLVASLLNIEDLPESVRSRILEKSEGNPFFVEEIIRSLLDGGHIIRENGRWRAAGEIEKVKLPATLNGVITARLDRLPEDARRVLQAAAVLGREFSARVLSAVVPASDKPLFEHLDEFQRRDLVREIQPHPQQTFSFKHVLTQEAAYQSILLSNRRELHRMSAEAIEDRDPHAAAEIAHHLVEARLTGRAIPYLVQAGQQANQAYAAEEAIRYFRTALESDASDPAQLVQIYEGLGSALTFTNRIPEALQVYQEMLAKAESNGSIAMQISALNKLASVTALNMGKFQEAETLLDQAEMLANQHHEKAGLPEANLLRCQICTARADFENVVYYMDQVVQIGQELDNQEYVAMGLNHVALSLIYLTRFKQAEERAREGLKTARQIGDRIHEAELLSETWPLLAFHHGDLEQAEGYLHQGLEIANRIQYLEAEAMATYFLGEISRWQGDYEDALRHATSALEIALPLEEYLPFLLAPVLGSLGMIYLEISPSFHEKTVDLHRHALRLLENPMGTMTGGLPWADLGLCAVMIGDLPLAQTVIETCLSTPNTYALLERPRHLAASAQIAGAEGDWQEARRLAAEARTFAETRGLRHHIPLTALVEGQVNVQAGEPEAALQALEVAHREAEAMGMHPILWQAHAAAAQAYAALGQPALADGERSAAESVLLDIASGIRDTELRELYLKSHQPKVIAHS